MYIRGYNMKVEKLIKVRIENDELKINQKAISEIKTEGLIKIRSENDALKKKLEYVSDDCNRKNSKLYEKRMDVLDNKVESAKAEEIVYKKKWKSAMKTVESLKKEKESAVTNSKLYKKRWESCNKKSESKKELELSKKELKRSKKEFESSKKEWESKKEGDSNNECTICFIEKKSHALSCGHVFCLTCANRFSRCPICNQVCRGKPPLKLFL